MRKGILIGGMVIGLLMGCNNGGEDPQKVFLKSVVSLGNNFLDVFTSFGEMAGGVLGFNDKTTKSQVGDYFKKVKETVEGTKTALTKIVSDMKEKGNPNASGVETAVNKLVTETLDKIIDGTKTVSEAIGDAKDPIANVAERNNGGAKGDTKDLIKGIKDIVDIVLKGVGNAEAGDDKKAEDGNAARTNNAGEAGKLFGNTGGTGPISGDAKKPAMDAAKAVGAVTGADILQAMVKNDGDALKLANTNPTSAAANITISKDATIAGAIVLRAMAKGGKFANDSAGTAEAVSAVKGAAVSAVTKALDTLTIAIRKTIDEGLKTVKEAMKINANDNPVTSEAKNQ